MSALKKLDISEDQTTRSKVSYDRKQGTTTEFYAITGLYKKDEMFQERDSHGAESAELKKPYALIGSIEGKLVSVGVWDNQPAILVEERLYGNPVWCLVSKEYEHDIAGKAGFEDVWAGRRVRVRGRLEYDSPGSLIRVNDVDDIKQIHERTIPLEAIRDRDFTGGLPINEYVDKLREGEIE